MPGARLTNRREGDRTEPMVQVFLDSVAFTTRILRQEDVGHDFLCVLAEPHGHMLWAGPSFTVQVKSENDPLVFEKDYALEWIRTQENPFFIAVGHKQELRVDIYSTWRRMHASLGRHARCIEFKLSRPNTANGYIVTAEDYSAQTVYLDRPIVSFALQDIMNKAKADQLRKVLRYWIELDRNNISQAAAGIHWIEGPVRYFTNEVPIESPSEGTVFWNPKNLKSCVRNFVRTAETLRLTLKEARASGAALSIEPESMIALESILGAFPEIVPDPAGKND